MTPSGEWGASEFGDAVFGGGESDDVLPIVLLRGVQATLRSIAPGAVLTDTTPSATVGEY